MCTSTSRLCLEACKCLVSVLSWNVNVLSRSCLNKNFPTSRSQEPRSCLGLSHLHLVPITTLVIYHTEFFQQRIAKCLLPSIFILCRLTKSYLYSNTVTQYKIHQVVRHLSTSSQLWILHFCINCLDCLSKWVTILMHLVVNAVKTL